MTLVDTSHAVASTSAGRAASLASSRPVVSREHTVEHTVVLVLALALHDLVVEGRAELARIHHVAVTLDLKVEAGVSCDRAICSLSHARGCAQSHGELAKVGREEGERLPVSGALVVTPRTFMRISSSAIACDRPIPSIGAVPRPSRHQSESQVSPLTSSTSTRERFVAIPGGCQQSTPDHPPRIIAEVAISAANVDRDFCMQSERQYELNTIIHHRWRDESAGSRGGEWLRAQPGCWKFSSEL